MRRGRVCTVSDDGSTLRLVGRLLGTITRDQRRLVVEEFHGLILIGEDAKLQGSWVRAGSIAFESRDAEQLCALIHSTARMPETEPPERP